MSISENPLKVNMVYQTMEATHYLEGNIAITLELLAEALRKLDLDDAAIAERRIRWKAEHDKWREGLSTAEESAAASEVITIPLLMKTLRRPTPPMSTKRSFMPAPSAITFCGMSRMATSGRPPAWARGWAMHSASNWRSPNAQW